MSIDQVIARARQGNVGFAERKQFKLARRRAIEKLRQFALADPYFYVLEVVQAAVAGGATYVDIACSEGDVLISWIGGYLREDELAQLFDFLFASKERVDVAHVRSLAVGVNALMLFEPEQVVIESGDGTQGGTTRMVVRAGADEVDVGRGEGQFVGTYIRATKLNRTKVAAEKGRLGDENGSLEYATVESRCLAAPVPIVFNGQSMFGWTSQRVPNLFGYKQVQSFDEGDLYGSVGLTPMTGEPSFQLLTHGVWVQSYQYDLMPGHKLGGVICFDRLHKTVDHSGFVQDDRFAELWLRLRPYAEALVAGRTVAATPITTADGLAYTPAELREYLRTHPRIVAIPPTLARRRGVTADPEQVGARAKAIARMLEAELLRVEDAYIDAIRVLGDRNVLVWQPSIVDDRDRLFYAEPPLTPPSAPHLLAPVELEPPSLDALVDELLPTALASDLLRQLEPAERPQQPRPRPAAPPAPPVVGSSTPASDLLGRLDAADDVAPVEPPAPKRSDEAQLRRRLRILLGESGNVRATLYSPVDPGAAAQGLLVRVLSTGRLIGERLYATAYPGRILDVELPTAQPSALKLADTALAVADRFAARALPVLREQDHRALLGLGVGTLEPDTPAARLALQVLARVTVTRLRAARPAGARGGGRVSPGLSFSLLRPTASGFDPLTLPILRTVSGIPLCLRELALLTDETAGLVYGTIPEVPADLTELDPDLILALDASSEATLIGLIGEASYVRIDKRDVLARADAVVVRDVALGLQPYAEFPLLVEGDIEAIATPEARDRLLPILLRGLEACMHGKTSQPSGSPLELEEHRRQAVRHLQWFVCRELARGGPQAVVCHGLFDLPLFVDVDGEVWSLRSVFAALRSPEGLLVHFGHTFGNTELGWLRAGGTASQRSPDATPSSLAVSAFVYRLLVPLGRVRLAFDFDLDDIEAARGTSSSDVAFLVEDRFADSWGAGVLGIPASARPEYRIMLRTRARGVVAAVDELAHRYGVVGSIELDDVRRDEQTSELILASLDQRATALVERLITKLFEFIDDPRRAEAALRVLLTYVGEQLTIIADARGLGIQVSTPLATRILGLPLFDLGGTTLASGQRVLERFRQEFARRREAAARHGGVLEPIDWSTIVAASTPPIVRAWLDAHLQPGAVILPASSVQASAPASERAANRWDPAAPLEPEALAWNLEHWLAQLRPDTVSSAPTRVWVVDHELPSAGLVDGGYGRIDLNRFHPLVERMFERPSADQLAWLLLACYAHINANSGLVSNSDEAEFHLRVGRALSDGTLGFTGSWITRAREQNLRP